MRRHLPPAILIAISVLGGLAVWFGPDDASAPITLALFFGSILGYFLGTISWVFLLGGRPSQGGGMVGRRLAILALGAPTALFAVIGVSAIAYFGDNSWMLLPYAIGPAVIVWPFVFVTLKKLRHVKRAAPT